MRTRRITQPHLELRPTGWHWRRRLPRLGRLRHPGHNPGRVFLLFPLRSDLPSDAKATARKLTLFSDLAFAFARGGADAMRDEVMGGVLEGLCRFLIESDAASREMLPARSAEQAEYEARAFDAATDALRRAYFLRDREPARETLRIVAARLGVPLDENELDWQRLAYRAVGVMIEAREEIARQARGLLPARSLAASAPVSWVTTSQPLPAPAAATMPVTTSAHTAPPRNTDPTAIGSDATDELNMSPAPCTAAPITAPIQERPTACAPAIPEPASAPRPSIRLSSLVDFYIEGRSRGLRDFTPIEQTSPKVGESWIRNSRHNVQSTGRLLLSILGDRPISEITDDDLKAAWELIQRLPKSHGKGKRKLAPPEAADEADREEAAAIAAARAALTAEGASPGRIEVAVLQARVPRLRAGTVYRHMQDFQRMMVCAVAKGWLDRNVMKGHIWSPRELARREELQEDNKRETWTDHLPALFRSPTFQEELEDRGDPMFWAPLIALHAGLRSEEVLQLSPDDVRDCDGVPCFAIQQGVGQSLKSDAARRIVPVHPNLIELGLLDLVDARRRGGEPRLFPWLARSASKKTYTETFSKLFTRYRKDNGLYADNRDFHAFRTTFNTMLLRTQCLDTQRRAMMGHSENDVGITNYHPDGFAPAELLARVSAVQIDISMIRRPFSGRPQEKVTSLMSYRRTATA